MYPEILLRATSYLFFKNPIVLTRICDRVIAGKILQWWQNTQVIATIRQALRKERNCHRLAESSKC